MMIINLMVNTAGVFFWSVMFGPFYFFHHSRHFLDFILSVSISVGRPGQSLIDKVTEKASKKKHYMSIVNLVLNFINSKKSTKYQLTSTI